MYFHFFRMVEVHSQANESRPDKFCIGGPRMRRSRASYLVAGEPRVRGGIYPVPPFLPVSLFTRRAVSSPSWAASSQEDTRKLPPTRQGDSLTIACFGCCHPLPLKSPLKTDWLNERFAKKIGS